ncbi:actin depolymerizing protein [Gyrodon lividus]|nr:actin depolymerizing protein [Gyrodon lividus]
MSLQVNLSSKEISDAYQNVVAGKGIDWAVFTYDKGSNDLKVQSTGNGGLEELEEEFSDGRIQYAFARVIDANSKLPKFVQINWCGDGVPEAKKGLFHTHSGAVAKFLRGTHVVVNARNESDVTPSLIMKRVEAASGAKYSAHSEQPRKFEPIAPVGTNYAPIGRPDISAMRKVLPAPSSVAPPPAPAASWLPAISSAAKPSIPTAPRPVFGTPARAPVKIAPPYNAFDDTWDDEPAPAVPARPSPAASRPFAVPIAQRPAVSSYIPTAHAVPSHPVSVVPSNVPTKPVEEDRIAPVVSRALKVRFHNMKPLVLSRELRILPSSSLQANSITHSNGSERRLNKHKHLLPAQEPVLPLEDPRN